MTSGTASPIPLFEEHKIRVIEEDGEPWFVVVDLSAAWGVHRNTLPDIINRNPEKFEGFAAIADDAHETCAGLTIVNEPGLYLLMGAVNTSRLKNPIAAETILRFQRWVPVLVQQYRKGEVLPAARIEDLIRQHLQIADAMANFAHVDRGIASSVALARVESETGADLSWCKALIRKDRQQPPGYLTPTEIGRELGGLPARDINRMLQQLGYQQYLGGRWQPTPIGQNYGENIPYTVTLRSGGQHSDYQLKWSPLIVEKLRDHLNGTNQVQSMLPAAPGA